jgi:nucleoside-diphosphate-sugar epimerase
MSVQEKLGHVSDNATVDQQTVDEILKNLQNSNKTFIYTSGTWILGNTGDVLADETTPTNPISEAIYRVEVEKRVLAAKNNGIKTIVIRPTIVYGHGGGLIGGFLATAKMDGYARYVGTGENRISTVHVDDLAKLYFLAAEKAEAGTILHASNDKPIKLREVAELVAEAAGHPGKVQSWPAEEARKVVGLVPLAKPAASRLQRITGK